MLRRMDDAFIRCAYWRLLLLIDNKAAVQRLVLECKHLCKLHSNAQTVKQRLNLQLQLEALCAEIQQRACFSFPLSWWDRLAGADVVWEQAAVLRTVSARGVSLRRWFAFVLSSLSSKLAPSAAAAAAAATAAASIMSSVGLERKRVAPTKNSLTRRTAACSKPPARSARLTDGMKATFVHAAMPAAYHTEHACVYIPAQHAHVQCLYVALYVAI